MGPRIYPSYQNIPQNTVGSIIFSFLPEQINLNLDEITISVNNELRKVNNQTIDGLYGTYIYSGDVVTISFSTSIIRRDTINIIRRDYTTDEENGNNGIYDTNIGTFFGETGLTYSYTFTATTIPSAYNFEYRLNLTTGRSYFGDGRFVLIGGTTQTGTSHTEQTLWLSSDYGETMTRVGPSLSIAFRSVGVSKTGQYMIAGGYVIWDGDPNPYVYISNDYGVTWTGNTALGRKVTSIVSIGSDGSTMSVDADGGIYISTNYGSSWTFVTNSSKTNWTDYTIPSNDYPQFGTVSLPYPLTENYLYKIESGTTGYTANTSLGLGLWTSLAVSDDIKYQIVGSTYDTDPDLPPFTTVKPARIYLSSDSGSTWNQINNGYNYSGATDIYLSINDNGKYILLGYSFSGPDGLLYSNNYGTTWTMALLYSDAIKNAISRSGQYMYAINGINGNYLEKSEDYGVTWDTVIYTTNIPYTYSIATNR